MSFPRRRESRQLYRMFPVDCPLLRGQGGYFSGVILALPMRGCYTLAYMDEAWEKQMFGVFLSHNSKGTTACPRAFCIREGRRITIAEKQTTNGPVKVFISYSHEDEEWKDRVVGHLRVLGPEMGFEARDDRRIEGGQDWQPAIERAIDGCSVALLLISMPFLTSKFILSVEVPWLLRLRAEAGVRVIPVILSPCAWKRIYWLEPINGRPKDGKALSSMSKADAEVALSRFLPKKSPVFSNPLPLPPLAMWLVSHPSSSPLPSCPLSPQTCCATRNWRSWTLLGRPLKPERS